MSIFIGLAGARNGIGWIGLTEAEPPWEARKTGSGEFARVYRREQPGLHKQVIGAEPLFYKPAASKIRADRLLNQREFVQAHQQRQVARFARTALVERVNVQSLSRRDTAPVQQVTSCDQFGRKVKRAKGNRRFARGSSSTVKIDIRDRFRRRA